MKAMLKAIPLCAALVAAAPSTWAQEAVRWGIPMSFGSNLTALGDTMPWVSEQLKKVSGGSINLQVFEPGKLVPALGIFDAVSTGKVEAGYSFMGYSWAKCPCRPSSAPCLSAWKRPSFPPGCTSVAATRC